MMDWDHLRFFAALAHTGTLAAAARTLGVEHTTVARRVQALEKIVGRALFVREVGGHRLTQAGQQLWPAVQAMEVAVRNVEQTVLPSAINEDGPSGLVRVGTTEGLGVHLLASHLARLTQRHPQLCVDLLALPRMLHLSRREADIVISLERPKRGPVVVSRLADYHLYLYGHRDYLARAAPIKDAQDLQGHSFIHYVDDLLFSKELQMLTQLHRPERFAFRSTSIAAQLEAVRFGAGLAVLPAFLADSDPDLQRVLPQQASFVRTFWMSMPQELRTTARVQAVWAFLRDVVRERQHDLRPPNGPLGVGDALK